MERALADAAVMAAARGLAVDGDQVGPIRPDLADPGAEAGREQARIDPVHQQREPACPRHPVMVGQEAAQELQALLPPGGDRLVVVAVGDRAADHQQQNLRQRVGDPPRLAGVLDDGQMVQKGAKAGLLSKHGGKAHDGAPESSTPPNHGPRKP